MTPFLHSSSWALVATLLVSGLLSGAAAGAQVPGMGPPGHMPGMPPGALPGQPAVPSVTGLTVTLAAKKTALLPFQVLELTVTVTNGGTAPTAAIPRSVLGGPKAIVAAGPPDAEMKRKGEWVQIEGPVAEGEIGPLLPGEAFSLPVKVRLPETLATPNMPVSVQWVGRGGAFEKARSNELTLALQDGKNPIATVETSEGTIVMELWPDKAPNHVASFLELAERGFYEGNLFHRVVRNFIVQTGGGDGTKSPGYAIAAEFNDTDFKKGVVGMARQRDDNDSAGSQWFICVSDQPKLNGQYTAFGRVLEGQEIADRISVVPEKDHRPVKDVVLKSVRVETPPSYVRPPVAKREGGSPGGDGQ